MIEVAPGLVSDGNLNPVVLYGGRVSCPEMTAFMAKSENVSVRETVDHVSVLSAHDPVVVRAETLG